MPATPPDGAKKRKPSAHRAQKAEFQDFLAKMIRLRQRAVQEEELPEEIVPKLDKIIDMIKYPVSLKLEKPES